MDSKELAVVTGGGSGIGRAAALALAQAGYSLALIGRREAPLRETAALTAQPDAVSVLPLDVTDEAAVEAAFDACAAQGRIDFLFNNAGSFGANEPFDQVALADWRAVIDVNLTGAFLCARAAFRRMKAQIPSGGRIVNCGSISAHVPRPRTAAYAASKHGMTGLTRTISLEGRQWNIACGQIDIGNTATALNADLRCGALQADGSQKVEPMMDVAHAAEAVAFMAGLPLDANVQFMTVMATHMPYIGRG